MRSSDRSAELHRVIDHSGDRDDVGVANNVKGGVSIKVEGGVGINADADGAWRSSLRRCKRFGRTSRRLQHFTFSGGSEKEALHYNFRYSTRR